MMLRQKIHSSGLPAMSAIVIYNDTVLWTGNFGKKNGSDPSSVVPNEYTIYRWDRCIAGMRAREIGDTHMEIWYLGIEPLSQTTSSTGSGPLQKPLLGYAETLWDNPSASP